VIKFACVVFSHTLKESFPIHSVKKKMNILIDGLILVLPVQRASFRKAASLADQAALSLRAGDALHLALCADNGATMCTLDQSLAKAAPLVGVEAVLL